MTCKCQPISQTEHEMDLLETAFRRGDIDEQEYDDQMDGLMRHEAQRRHAAIMTKFDGVIDQIRRG